jgi:hypothetical protein
MASSLGIGKTQRDFTATAEIRARMSKAHLGKKLSEHHKAALRRRTLNESVFDQLTEDSQYWFGFMFTDGNVCYKQGIPIIALHLNEIDLAHLLKFREFVGSSHKEGHYVNKVWGNSSNSISFLSERMANALAKYGCVPRKCFNGEIKGGMENYRHCWRGVIDGDGSLGVYERKDSGRRVPYISLTGNKSVCLQFRDFLQTELDEPMPQNVIFYKKSYSFMVSDHRAVKAIELLYTNCTIALNRKLQRADEILHEFEGFRCSNYR